MISKKEFISLMDAVYETTFQSVELPDYHPCKECPASAWDPVYCDLCADFQFCPGLHPDLESGDSPRSMSPPEAPFKRIFKMLS